MRKPIFFCNDIERDTNFGLAKSIVEGVTSLCKKYGTVVVVEDDLEVSPDFLKFMSVALERYYDAEEVMQIAGHTIAPPPDLKNQTPFSYRLLQLGVGVPGSARGIFFLGACRLAGKKMMLNGLSCLL